MRQNDQLPPADHVGHHFYWLSTLNGGPLAALFNETPLRDLAQSLIAPGTIEIAFNQVQVALNIPPFSHRPGGHHLDGYQEGEQTPGTFTVLAACSCRNRRLKTLETCGCGREPTGRTQLFFESVVRTRSSNPKDTRVLNCRSRVRFWVDQAMLYWRTTCSDITSAGITQVIRFAGLCTFVYGEWATSNVGGNVYVTNCSSSMLSVGCLYNQRQTLLANRKKHLPREARRRTQFRVVRFRFLVVYPY